MGLRLFLIVCFSALAGTILIATGVGIWMIYTNLPAEAARQLGDIAAVYGGALAFLLVAMVAVLWAFLDQTLAQPLSALVRGIQTVVHANSDYRVEIEGDHQLGTLPVSINELIRQLGIARTSVNEAIEKATASIEQQKKQLATILQDLHEGVIVCTLDHRILLYNTRALELLRLGGEIGLDRSLLHFLARQPVLHALGRVEKRLAQGRLAQASSSPTVPFFGSTIDGRHTLEGRISLLLDAGGKAGGYVLSFEDDTEELAALGLRDRLLREATEGLRAPAGNLRAAAEILAGSTLTTDEEAGFRKVLLQESHHLCSRLETLSAQYRDVITGSWPMSDIYSSNLIQALADRLREQRGFAVGIVGIPQRFHGDSYSLVELLDQLILRTSEWLGTTRFDAEAVAGERRVYLDVIWTGPVLPAALLNRWLEEQLDDVLGGLSLRDILERHKTDIWSQPDRPGQSRLRLPLPPAQSTPSRPPSPAGPDAAVEPAAGPPASAAPRRCSRPEFYDFDLLQRPLDLGDLARRPLKSLTYVVFDTETTGLDPAGGDEIVALAGVRVVNGRILTGESFERLVNPRRRIPEESIRFHGITQDIVKDKPPIHVVLPQFRAFVGDAILVAHNAAFDLKFLKLHEAECGVSFDMAALDTMLLSCFLHDHTPKHGLEEMAQRFAIPVEGRHTALGDSLVTAGCFLKMLDLLELQDVVTLDQALEAVRRIMQMMARQASFRS